MDRQNDISSIETPHLMIRAREKRRLVVIYGIIAGSLLFAGLSQAEFSQSSPLFFIISTIFIFLSVQQYLEVIKIEKEIMRRNDAYTVSVLIQQKKGRSIENTKGWALIAILFFIAGIILLPYDVIWTGLSFVILGIGSSVLSFLSWLEWRKLSLSTI